MPVTEGETTAATISVIMPVYNGTDFIRKSLPPLLEMQQRGEVLEVLVIDDSSTDDTPDLAARMGARVMPSGGRMGPGGARNQAAEVAEGDILWFVDADVVVHEDAARRLLGGFEATAAVAIFGSYDSDPPAQNFFSRYKNLVHHYYHHKASEEAQTFWSGCGAVQKDAFLATGGFNVERYKYPSIEDIELGHRLIKAGGSIRLLREVECTHLKVWRLGNLLHTEIFRRAIPWSRLILNSGEGIPNDLNVGMSEQVRAVVAGIFLLSILAALAGCLSPPMLLIPLLLMLYANKEIALFFSRRGGPLFAVAALLFHQVYYLYSASAFTWVVMERVLAKILRRAPPD